MSGFGLKVLNKRLKFQWHYLVGALVRVSLTLTGETLSVSVWCGGPLEVIASCDNDEKVALALRLGAGHAFNYRTSHTSEELRRHGTIDIYFDNMGGPILEAVPLKTLIVMPVSLFVEWSR
ncbi:hypothetical protein EV421DRAFT_1738391 [Armillaria borealis]|uniref:Alcohol dehydrogenase-like C-terminal domain-containing protein n=1 Tax=Armillaria borealis TaxID=47425 RepID=A0AA39J9H5_9AGAR|nr:hypothetical protein EV421DRAFT_1738391 [Armillaria borealis]